MDDAELQERLEAARQDVQAQREALRASRRRLREQGARVSATSDRALARVLRARGQAAAAEPPVPTHLPDWLSGQDGPGGPRTPDA